ncbi:MAG: hypothetical protein M0R48_04105 [Candidatus Omnitrophica bacterium]|jgi:glucan phosphoethanolaminetransferase (alkaline phosphatase superfamily)|nr:hypothetical protein [Candidatus Omnitrophota bacterium]
MRKKISFLLLVVFAVFLGIVIFHPFVHSLHHDRNDAHECPICIWLYYAAFIFFFAAIFYVIFHVVSFIDILATIPLVKILLSANISRAPPYALY